MTFNATVLQVALHFIKLQCYLAIFMARIYQQAKGPCHDFKIQFEYT